jgi:hypothetical protein
VRQETEEPSPADKIGFVDPALLEAFGLNPDVLHLNHGAFGVAPVVVRRAAAAWRERAERNPQRFNRVEIGGLVAAARERAAGFLGVDPARAAWVRWFPKECPQFSARWNCILAMNW